MEDLPKDSKTIKTPQEHTLVLKKEKRRGKPVTRAGEFFLEKKAIQKLLKKLKSTLACGGTYKDGFMEFQGEVREPLKELLQKEGFHFKH